MSEIKTWYLERLSGDGRGDVFFNSPYQFTHEESGLEILGWEGYEEDEDWDDFGSQYYSCTVKGTEEQVKNFINEYYYGEGTYSEDWDQ